MLPSLPMFCVDLPILPNDLEEDTTFFVKEEEMRLFVHLLPCEVFEQNCCTVGDEYMCFK